MASSKCIVCGKAIQPKPPRKKGPAPRFCAECLVERRRASDRVAHNRAWKEGRTKQQRLRSASPRPEVPCPVCGKMFQPLQPGERARKRYCSSTCREERKRGQQRQHKKVWRAANPDKAQAIDRKRSATPKRKAYERQRGLRRSFNLAPEDFEKMLTAQSGVCAICGRLDSGRAGRTWYVDHDHFTGKVRGLLCLSCNAGLGLFEDSAQRLLEAADYLERHEQRRTP